MPEYLQTSIEPYLDSFAESFAAENYTPATINAYRLILRKVGRVMDAEGISPSALTLDMAEQVGRQVPRKHAGTAWPYKLARRFAQHLLDIGVTQPVPLTEVQQAPVGENEIDAEHRIAYDAVLRAQEAARVEGDVAAHAVTEQVDGVAHHHVDAQIGPGKHRSGLVGLHRDHVADV